MRRVCVFVLNCIMRFFLFCFVLFFIWSESVLFELWWYDSDQPSG